MVIQYQMNQVAINLCLVANISLFTAIVGFTHSFTFYPITQGKTVRRFYPATL